MEHDQITIKNIQESTGHINNLRTESRVDWICDNVYYQNIKFTAGSSDFIFIIDETDPTILRYYGESELTWAIYVTLRVINPTKMTYLLTLNNKPQLFSTITNTDKPSIISKFELVYGDSIKLYNKAYEGQSDYLMGNINFYR
jgi:hypothetical protein